MLGEESLEFPCETTDKSLTWRNESGDTLRHRLLTIRAGTTDDIGNCDPFFSISYLPFPTYGLH